MDPDVTSITEKIEIATWSFLFSLIFSCLNIALSRLRTSTISCIFHKYHESNIIVCVWIYYIQYVNWWGWQIQKKIYDWIYEYHSLKKTSCRYNYIHKSRIGYTRCCEINKHEIIFHLLIIPCCVVSKLKSKWSIWRCILQICNWWFAVYFKGTIAEILINIHWNQFGNGY